MQFIEIENVGDHKEMILNMDNISALIKNKKFIPIISNNTPYYSVDREEVENEFEYFLILKGGNNFQISEEKFELIKKQIEYGE